MDTYRVPLPHPQPVENEEEFVTDSGRKVKRPIVVEEGNEKPAEGLKLPDANDEHLASSGVSVMSTTPAGHESAQDGQLSNSVQAELHLSLDRLSENYDSEELKKLQEKSENSRSVISERKKQNSRGSVISQNIEKEVVGLGKREVSDISQDSLDTELTPRTPIPIEMDSETSEEFVVSGEEDDHTIVADSLNYQSLGERGASPSSAKSSTKSGHSVLTPVNKQATPDAIDQYANLRYNPNWRNKQAQKSNANEEPLTIDFKSAPKIDDSLDEEQLVEDPNTGGAIVVHKKGLYSPVIPNWGNERLPASSKRSLSPTRLSADPVKLQQTNTQYEEEFNKMLKAEILENPDQLPEEKENELSHNIKTPLQETPTPRNESYSVLIRKLEQSDKRSTAEEPMRLGRYQLLPDRHRIPSPSLGVASQQTSAQKPQRTPKKLASPGRYQSPDENYYIGKKDPLAALSPRDKKRVSVAPTPPKVPKPKDVDYIELNKQRLGRKTNSAGYLDLHRKRSRQTELLQTRSQSELNGSVTKQSPGHIVTRRERNEVTGSIEDIWAAQAERLKIAKGQNVNKGKVMRPTQRPLGNGMGQAMDSPRTNMQYWDGRTVPQNGEWYPYLQQHPGSEIEPAHLQQNISNSRGRQHLPVPSQAVHHSPRQFNRPSPIHEDISDTSREAGIKGIYFSPRMQQPQNQASPNMKPFQAQYATEAYEPNIINTGRGHILRQNFNERNFSLPPQYQTTELEVWMNPDDEAHMRYAQSVLQSNHSKMNRRVTFLGDNQHIAIDGFHDTSSMPFPVSGNLYRHKVPLPPTPPSKSQRHTIQRARMDADGKENDGGYYDVREENYPILPPILKSSPSKSPLKQSPNGGHNESARSENDESYYEKPKRRSQYKIYTLNDYRNLKKDVKLGGLGPDLKSAREKMDKVDRGRKYAELIRKEHMTNATIIKPKEEFLETNEFTAPAFDEKHHFSATMDENKRREMYKRRNRAIEYSKRIPKPKTKPVVTDSAPVMSDLVAALPDYSSSDAPATNSPNSQEGIDFNFGLIEMLKERHEKEKAQVAAFAGKS